MDAGLPVRAFFTDRVGGVSAAPFEQLNLSDAVGDEADAVRVNRSLMADRMEGPVVFMRPEHGTAVVRIGADTQAGEQPPKADILITTVPGLSLAALAADCVPVLMHDAVSGAVVAAHVGREGLRKGAVDAAAAALHDVRGGWFDGGAITVAIGPAICGRCYEVSTALRAEVSAVHPIAASTTSWGAPALDIPRAVAGRLTQLGFTRVVHHRYCTHEEARLFSYRREGVTGRQAGVVRCEGPAQ